MKVLAKSSQVRVQLRVLPVARLLPTADNRRREITRASVESLARSLSKDGVLQPIVVRPHPEKKDCWEIRAGERRWRAAKLAGLSQIPAIVRALDDESALAVTIAENMQRQDLHPLEEAATIQQAFDRGHNIKAVAARLGKSVPYITRRASLSRLSPAWREEVLKPDSEASRLSVAHLELVARLPEETQTILAEDSFGRVFAHGFPTVEQLRKLIDGGLRTLKVMPWPLGDETLEPAAGSCINCPKRSGKHPVLFDTEDAPQDGKISKSDRCLDPTCFDRKHAAFLERRESELKATHQSLRLVHVGFERLSPGVREKLGDRVTQVYQPRFVKPNARGATPAMQVDGPKAGTLVHIDFGESVSGSGGGRRSSRTRDDQGKSGPMPLSERKARLQKRRDAFLVQRVGESLRALTVEGLTKTVAELSTRTDPAAKRFSPLALVLAFGTSTRADRDHDDSPWKRYEELLDRSQDLPIVAALQEVSQVWARRLGGSDTHHVTEQAADALKICEVLMINAEAIKAEAAQMIPTPKGWAAMSEDTPKPVEEPPFVPTGPTALPKTVTGKGKRAKHRRSR